MSIDKDLGALICMLNPYTYGKENAMDPHVLIPADYSGPALPPAAGGAATTTAAPASGTTPAPSPDMTGVWIEIDKQHPHWEFKEQPHRIAKAVASPTARLTRSTARPYGSPITCWRPPGRERGRPRPDRSLPILREQNINVDSAEPLTPLHSCRRRIWLGKSRVTAEASRRIASPAAFQ